MSILNDLSLAVQHGRIREVDSCIASALEQGFTVTEIFNGGLLRGMSELGVRFKSNEVFVPEVLIASRAMTRGTDKLKPLLLGKAINSRGKVVLATVKGDLHDIGKNLVGIMLQGVGFEVIDLGTNVDADTIIEAVLEHRPDIVALSALLTTTMAQLGIVVEALQAAGLRDSVKVMVGGAPVTQAYCEKIGADAYACDAGSCAQVAWEILHT